MGRVPGGFLGDFMHPYWSRYNPSIPAALGYLILWASYWFVAGCVMAGRWIMGRGK